jgi:hypothetical protein
LTKGVNNSNLIGGVWNTPAIDTNGEIFKFCVNAEKVCVSRGVKIRKGAGIKKFLRNKERL